MDHNKIFRMVVALVLVCCLLINVSPVRAQAVGVGTAVAISGLTVIAGIVICLGILPGDVKDDFDHLVGDIFNHLSGVGYIDSEGMISVLKVAGAVGTGSKLFVDQNLVSEVRQFLVSSAVLTVKHTYLGDDVIARNHNNATAEERQRMIEAQGYKYIVVIDSSAERYGISVIVSDVPIVFSYSDDNVFRYYVASDGSQLLFANGGQPFYTTTSVQNYVTAKTKYCDYVGAGVCTVESSLNLNFGHVNITSSAISDGYSTWSDGSLKDDDEQGNEHIYLPVGIGDSYSSTSSKTQEELWTGDSTYEDTSTDSGTDVGGATSSISQSWLGSKLDSFILSISGFFSDIISTVQAIPGAFSTWFQDVISSVQAIPGAFSIWFQDVISGLQSIPDSIAGVLSDAFAVSDTFVSSKVEALTAKYPYLDTFRGLGLDLKDFFSNLGVKPPIIYIHLDSATGSIYWGGSQPFLDLSWYSDYKDTMDNILGGFIWLWLGWRTYLSLPGIISGASGVWGAYQRASEVNTKSREEDDV